MNSVVVVQARTNSSRLPGKVLLPVNDIPLVVLASKRAANTGRKVIVATSTEATDDALAALIARHGIRLFRGSLHNTLERVVTALSGYDDDTLVFRLTADNVFPDGSLLDEIEKDFVERDLEYLCCNGVSSGLPYGMSAELTRLRHLRSALFSTNSKYDQEHVTPYIKRKFGDAYFEKYNFLGKGHLRCTIDCLDDYLAIQKLFSSVSDPIQHSAFNLVEILSVVTCQASQPTHANKLVLGTAQLGLSYGVSNISGQPDQELAEKIIKTAIVNGATFIDTARAYGNSEEVIGLALNNGWAGRSRIITKLSPLNDCPSDATAEVVGAFVDASIYKSCTALRVPSLDVLMLHRACHMTYWNGAVWDRLLKYKADGTLNVLGVSIQNTDELEMVLDVPEVDLIQMPFNLLDWRWDHLQDKIRARKQRSPLLIHVRGALLQGLIPSDNLEYWQKANATDPVDVLSWLAQARDKTNSVSVVDLSLRFVKSIDWIDGIVIGMESLSQLTENVKILCGSDLLEYDVDAIIVSRPKLEESTLNPAFWR